MSEQTDSGLEVQEQPDGNQDVSQPKSVSETPTGNSLEGAALAEALRNDSEAFEIVRRQLQSDKDKGIAAANKKSERALSEVERISQYLSDEDRAKIYEAQQLSVLDDLVKERYSQATVAKQSTAETQAPASKLDFIEAFKEAGIDLNSLTSEDREYITSKGCATQTDLKNEIFAKFAGEKPRTISPAGAVQPGGTTQLPTSSESLKQQREALLADRDKMISVEGRDELKRINRQLEQLDA